MDLARLLTEYGYIAVFFGTFLEGESFVLFAGFFAQKELLRLPAVFATAYAGSLCGQIVWFLLGRRQGSKLLERYAGLRKQSEKAVRLLDRFGVKALFISQYVYGFRIALSVVFGISKISFLKFVGVQAISCAGWALLIATLGYTGGEAIERIFERTEHLERYGLAVVVAAALAIYFYTRQREKRMLEKATESAPPDSPVDRQ